MDVSTFWKISKQIKSNARHLIILPINVESVNIDLIYCQGICNKSNEVTVVMTYLKREDLVFTKQWLTGLVS